MFRGAKKRTFRFGKKNVSFPKVETFRFADYNGSKEQSPKLLIKGIQVDNICKTTTFSKLMRSVVSFKMSPITSKTKIAYDVKGFNSSLNIINKQTSFFENINLLFRGYGSICIPDAHK